jgi:hypothetical protein
VLRVQRLVAGAWVGYSVVPATCRDSAAGSSYAGSLRLPAGSWRVSAQTPSDASHAAGSSAWTTLALR